MLSSFSVEVGAAISVQARARLMEMTYERLRFGAFAMPFVAFFLVLAYAQEHEPDYLALWAVAYTLYGLTMYAAYKRVYLPDCERLSSQALLDKWLPLLKKIAWGHGAGLALPIVIMGDNVSSELGILWFGTLAAIIAGNATHQTPVLGIFMRFFTASWNLNIVFIAWVQPPNWPVVMGLATIYSVTMYRHAYRTHHFFVDQVRLQEHSEELAAQFLRAKELAESALAQKNQFLTTASHDLRQPVHAMGMLVEAIGRQNENAKIEPLIADLRSSIRSVNLMFNSLLDLSKIESQEVKALPQRVLLQDLAAEIVTVFRQEALSQGLSLRLRSPKKAVWLDTDPNLLRRALTNLIHNALRYTQHGGVLIALRQRQGEWQFEVWDTGIGVADNEHERIFSPYFRDENAWSVDRSGYGLGLAVVGRCALLLGATYGLKSQLGRGTRFWFRLPGAAPRAMPEPAPVGAAQQPNDKLAELKGQCLVLEDDPLLISAMTVLLAGWGVQARFATCAAEAFAHLDAGFQPQALLCDQRLRSGESGFELMCALLERCPHASAAMMSGEFDSPALQQADAEGYVVLRKPVDVNQLHALLERWLTRHR
jgi:signal transduction histidine kinase